MSHTNIFIPKIERNVNRCGKVISILIKKINLIINEEILYKFISFMCTWTKSRDKKPMVLLNKNNAKSNLKLCLIN